MASQIYDGQKYAFISWANLNALDLYESKPGPVKNYPAHLDKSSDNQIWKAAKMGSGSTFKLHNTISDCVLDLAASQVNGDINGFSENQGSNQEWTFISASGAGETPSFFIKSVATGQAITIPGGSGSGTTLKALDIGSGQDAKFSRWIAVPTDL